MVTRRVRGAAAASVLVLAAATVAVSVPPVGPTPPAEASSSTAAATYAPAVTSAPGSSRTDVFYRTRNQRILYRTSTNGTWSAPTNLGGAAVNAPAAAYAGGSLYVVIRGADGAAYTKVRSTGTWDSTWTRIGGTLTSSPAVAGWPDGRVEVFARGAADQLVTATSTPGTGWGTWTSLGGTLTTAPAAAVTGPASLRVCAALADHLVSCRTRSGDTWSAWTLLGGSTYSSPAVVAEPGSGRVHVLIRAQKSNALSVRTYASGTWSAYRSLGGTLVDGPGAASRASGTVDVVVRAAGGALNVRQMRDGVWASSYRRAWTPGAPPALPSSLKGRNLTVVPTSAKVVALTFDGGAGAQGVPSILATLKRDNVRATFFPTGDFVRMFPASANQIAVSGMDVGNHSNTHPYFTKISGDTERAQVTRARTAIFTTTGVEAKPLFRFPYGAYTSSDVTLVNGLGYVPVGWTVDTLGWQGRAGGMSAQKVVDRVLAGLRPGEIVLMHVGANPDDGTTFDADALPALVDALRAHGYGFVTLEELTGW